MTPRFARSRWLTAALAAAVASLVSLPADAQTKWTKLTIATEGAYAPWNFMTPSGKIDGFEVDLTNNLCARMKVECSIIAQDWDGIVPALQARKYDAIIAGMSITEKRKEVMNFAGPYANDPNGFGSVKGTKFEKLPGLGSVISLSKSPAEAKSAIDALRVALKGATIGVQVSTTNANFLDKYFKDVATIQEYKTTEQHDLDLNAGRLDAIFAVRGAIVATGEQPEFKNVVVSSGLFTGDILGDGVGVGLRKSDPELKAMFDEAIKAALADGTLRELSMKWFKADITPK